MSNRNEKPEEVESYAAQRERENAEYRKWLDELRIGDEVRVGERVLKVHRLTPTQIALGLDDKVILQTRYRRSDGSSIGTGAWDSSNLLPMTEEFRQTLKCREIARRLNQQKFLDFP